MKYNLATSNGDVGHIFASRVLPQLLQPMGGRKRMEFLSGLFTMGAKSPYLSDLSANTAVRAALVEDAQRLYQREQADKARELSETLQGAKNLPEFTTATMSIAQGRAAGDINETHWQDLNQKIAAKSREVHSRVKIEAKLDGDPRFAAEAINGSEQQLFADIMRERLANEPMTFDQQIRLELGTGDLSSDTKERIRNLVEAPAMKRPDGTLDTANIEQGIAALQTIKEATPLYYQQRYIDNRDALTSHMELAVSLLDAGFPRSQVVNWISQIDRIELGKAEAALTGAGAVRRRRLRLNGRRRLRHRMISGAATRT